MSSDCKECNNVIKKEEGIECAGPCQNIFHLKCVGISPRDYKTFKCIDGCKWFCKSCLTYYNFVGQISKEFLEFKNCIMKEFNKVKELVTERKPPLETVNVNRTYANTLRGEAVVIKPKSSQESCKTKEMITQKLNPCNMEVGITQIKDVRDGGILIKCKTKEEIEKLKTEAEKSLGKQFQITVPKKYNPLLKIVDFDENMSKEKLLECMMKQNEFLRNGKAKITVNLIKKMKTRFMAIIECDPDTHERILQEGSLSIGWVPACRVFDYVQILRCYQCGGYGHGAKICSNEKICTKCCSPDHTQEVCSAKTYTCKNCIDANVKYKFNFDTNHSMYDLNNCMVYKKQFNMKKQNTLSNSQ